MCPHSRGGGAPRSPAAWPARRLRPPPPFGTWLPVVLSNPCLTSGDSHGGLACGLGWLSAAPALAGGSTGAALESDEPLRGYCLSQSHLGRSRLSCLGLSSLDTSTRTETGFHGRISRLVPWYAAVADFRVYSGQLSLGRARGGRRRGLVRAGRAVRAGSSNARVYACMRACMSYALYVFAHVHVHACTCMWACACACM